MKTNLVSTVAHPTPPVRAPDMPSLASKIEIVRTNQTPQYFPATWFANGDVVVLIKNEQGREEAVDYSDFLNALLSRQALPAIEKVTIMGSGLSHICATVVPASPNTDHTSVSTYLGVTKETNFLRPKGSVTWGW